ncbi:hypothetical protein GQ53DRAFT_229204 [Thozetella sp. PMI_491]|nr:hypothetical protein GQ53DRAFT_229204 [Thozetella sp. PMI_491]
MQVTQLSPAPRPLIFFGPQQYGMISSGRTRDAPHRHCGAWPAPSWVPPNVGLLESYRPRVGASESGSDECILEAYYTLLLASPLG